MVAFSFLFLPKTTMRSVPAVLPPLPPPQLHNETFVSQKLLVMLNILIRNVISPDQY